jgi:ribosomal protein L15
MRAKMKNELRLLFWLGLFDNIKRVIVNAYEFSKDAQKSVSAMGGRIHFCDGFNGYAFAGPVFY